MAANLLVRGNTLFLGDKSFTCAIGWGGFSANKREGDGATPIGTFALRECWYRADRGTPPETGLRLREIRQDDGWCDAPEHAHYNRHVKLPFPASHEKLWQEDHVYDLIVPLGYNDEPIRPGAGSAIFMHLARDNYSATQGCVALAKEDLLEVLRQVNGGSVIEIAGI